jgi:hypothetical protein
MENESNRDQARAALDVVGETRLAVARKFRTAWWYHIGIGILAGGLIVALAYQPVGWWATAILPFLGLSLLLRSYYRRRLGVWGYGPRSGAAGLWNGLIAIVGIAAVALVRWGEIPLWASWAAGAAVMVAATLCGAALDATIRRRMAPDESL